jgi:predicted Zn finger-like uncharacterized protein
VFTQCPDCATVFRITAEALRAAQGDVRCGVCSTSFNALENLSEQAFNPATTVDAPSPDDSMTVEELPGGENIELSAPVELTAVPDAPTPQPAEAADDEARAMEFHGDAADLDRLFVVENPALASFDPAAAAANLAVAEPPVDLDSTDEHPILVLDERDEPPSEPEPEAAKASTEEGTDDEPDAEDEVESIVLETPAALAEPPPQPARPPPPASASHTAPRILIPDEMRKRLAEEAAARAAAARAFETDDEDSPGFLSQRWPWVAGCALLALLLVLQVIHSARNELVRNPTFGPVVAGAYAILGLSLLAPTDLSAYELRQWGAASDPREANRLMLRASIVNRASYAQPLPLLRLTLQDRFGGTLGMRDIGPADYLPGAGATGLLEPGQRADALIRIVDPGAEAVGFELDICLPAQGGVRCANQIKTARQ